MSGPEQPNLRNPTFCRSVLSARHSTPRSTDAEYMQPGSWMTPSTMEVGRAILRSLCANSRSVVWRPGSDTWPKFTAFATDWNDAISSIGLPFSPDGIQATGWNIWKGGIVSAVVPRAQADTISKLLGKRGSILDRHSLAAMDTVSKIRALRFRASTIRASWDELATMWQLIARGIVGYAPLVDTPSPADLHAEDTAFLYSILAGMGARSTTERPSLTAPRCVGGLQLPSIVECVVGAVASEPMFLLNGRTLATDIARDSLKEAMYVDPNTVDLTYGLVLKAMAFLAG